MSAYGGSVANPIPDTLTGVVVVPVPPVRSHLGYVTLTGDVTPAPDTAAVDETGRAPGLPPRWSAGYAVAAYHTTTRGPIANVYAADALDTAGSSRRGTLPLVALWGERRIAPATHLTVAAGLRVETGAPVRGEGSVRVAPRVTARYSLGEGGTALSAGVGRHYQYVQGIPESQLNRGVPVAAVLRPVPLWIVADRDTPALRTDLATVGLERWTGAGWDWTLNTYLRRSTGLVLGDERAGPGVGRPLFTVGGEGARGVELGVRRVVGRWTGSASYALSRAITDAYGLHFPSGEDRRSVLNATAGVRIGAGGRFGAAFTSLSGAPYTRLFSGVLTRDSRTGSQRWYVPPEFGAPNAQRLPAFQRLDLTAEWTWAVRRARIGGYLQLLNATGRENSLGVGRPEAVPWPSFTNDSPTNFSGWTAESQAPIGLPRVPLIGFRASF